MWKLDQVGDGTWAFQIYKGRILLSAHCYWSHVTISPPRISCMVKRWWLVCAQATVLLCRQAEQIHCQGELVHSRALDESRADGPQSCQFPFTRLKSHSCVPPMLWPIAMRVEKPSEFPSIIVPSPPTPPANEQSQGTKPRHLEIQHYKFKHPYLPTFSLIKQYTGRGSECRGTPQYF